MRGLAAVPRPAMKWSPGNAALSRFKLLENGEDYFPAIFSAIAAARREIIIETFILFEDEVGKELHSVLIAAARRGVHVDVTIDDYGSPNLSPPFIEKLIAAGVRLHIYDPRPRLFGMRTNMFRRLHRKIVAIDGVTAFIGGINFSADHLASFGKDAKQDFAVRIDGTLAGEIHRFAREQLAAYYADHHWWSMERLANRRLRRMEDEEAERPKSPRAFLIYRDNEKHRDDIERHYRAAIHAAKRSIIIACAYFFPGYRLLRQLRRAARRGVAVKLILQGAPDVPQAKTWATMLYPSLLEAGVEIHEYCRRPLHAKVAAIDNEWTTIGSSNLDPASLSLNLEANVVIRDANLNYDLRQHLESLLARDCRKVSRDSVPRGSVWLMLSNVVAYHCTRHFPRWATWIPARLPKLHSIEVDRSEHRIKHFPHGVGASGDRCGN